MLPALILALAALGIAVCPLLPLLLRFCHLEPETLRLAALLFGAALSWGGCKRVDCHGHGLAGPLGMLLFRYRKRAGRAAVSLRCKKAIQIRQRD